MSYIRVKEHGMIECARLSDVRKGALRVSHFRVQVDPKSSDWDDASRLQLQLRHVVPSR